MKPIVWIGLLMVLCATALGFAFILMPKAEESKAPEVHTCVVPAGYYGEIRELREGGYLTYTCNIFKDKTNELVKVYHYGVPKNQYRGSVVQVQQQ